ncbi:DUF3108 domain-containing protein [Massilia sp. TS11]|uniref:DUF3108 domain-containing protein n=1 Tax=Massilia sp. TS11 TaxID=2908003 RepID=UPI001EDC861C|nr:DUF3108 domain-containing protein [Massilia sp. TS11]MCG2585029.1 DUF3108 domain-containing protein [Massilia sp. TS11]
MKATVLLAAAVLALSAQAGEHSAVKRPANLPSSMDLAYTISAKQKGIPLGGRADIQWRLSGDKYSIHAETRASLLGKILVNDSEGNVDANGLIPVRFYEERFRRPPVTTSFNQETRTISFSEGKLSYPIKGGEQDRTSITWALVGAARAAPEKFVAGSEWAYFVAGRRDAERWSFKVAGTEAIQTRLGELQAVHLVKAPPPDSKDQQLDIWLAPAQDWLPVRLRFSDADGDYVDQVLEKITKK